MKKQGGFIPGIRPGKPTQEYLEKVTRIFLVAVGIGVVFFVGGLFVLALLWIGRKLRKANDRRK